jgi:hypothetical protein
MYGRNGTVSDQVPEDSVPDIDTTRPHPARIYDYLLGGYFLNT